MAFLTDGLTIYWPSILLKQAKENLLRYVKIITFFHPQFWQRQLRCPIYFLSRKTSQGHEKFDSIVRYGLNVEKKRIWQMKAVWIRSRISNVFHRDKCFLSTSYNIVSVKCIIYILVHKQSVIFIVFRSVENFMNV